MGNPPPIIFFSHHPSGLEKKAHPSESTLYADTAGVRRAGSLSVFTCRGLCWGPWNEAEYTIIAFWHLDQDGHDLPFLSDHQLQNLSCWGDAILTLTTLIYFTHFNNNVGYTYWELGFGPTLQTLLTNSIWLNSLAGEYSYSHFTCKINKFRNFLRQLQSVKNHDINLGFLAANPMLWETQWLLKFRDSPSSSKWKKEGHLKPPRFFSSPDLFSHFSFLRCTLYIRPGYEFL